MKSRWPRISRLKERTRVTGILANAGWLGVERFVRSVTALFVTVWIARYLGPEQFGLLNYAQSIVVTFAPVATFGLTGIVVRNLVQQPQSRDELLTAAFLIRAVGIALSIGLAIFAGYVVSGGDRELVAVTVILALGFLSLLADTVECDYQARMDNRSLVTAKTAVFALATVLKILLVVVKAGLIWFAVVMTAESVAISLVLWAMAVAQRRTFRFRFQTAFLFGLVRQGWPLFLVAATVSVNSRLDQIMLGYFTTYVDVGIYAASWKIVEALTYLPMLSVVAMAPVFSALRNESSEIFGSKFALATQWLFWPMFGVSLICTLGAGFLMPLLFGERFRMAAPVLAILVWTLPIVALNALCTQWAINHDKAGLLVEQGVAGVLSCLAFGVFLIPAFGVTGAAASVLLSQGFSYLVYGWFRPAGREILRLQARAILFRQRAKTS